MKKIIAIVIAAFVCYSVLGAETKDVESHLSILVEQIAEATDKGQITIKERLIDEAADIIENNYKGNIEKQIQWYFAICCCKERYKIKLFELFALQRLVRNSQPFLFCLKLIFDGM